MLKHCLIIFLCMVSVCVYGQSGRKVEGTVAIGCKVFNYTFTKSPQSLYSFYIEDIEKEGSLITFDKEKIGKLKTSYEKFLEKTRAAATPHGGASDSLDTVARQHIQLTNDILDDKVTLLFWHTNRDSLKKIIEVSKSIRLATAVKDSTGDSLLTAYVDTLEKIGTKVEEIFKAKSYTLYDFNQQSFVKLAASILKRYRMLYLPECNGETDEEKLANAMFFEIKARIEFADDQPVTAKLKLKNYKVNVYYSSTSRLNTKEKTALTKMSVQNVTVEFEDGTIKNLFADLVFDEDSPADRINLPSRFKNTFPISVSGRNETDKFGNIKLFIGDASEFYSKFNIADSSLDKVIFNAINDKEYGSNTFKRKFYEVDSTTDRYHKQKEKFANKILKGGQVYIQLSELLGYYIEAENDNEDYSPANVVVQLNKENISQELKKELRSKILSVRTYTDFVGLQGDQPNGLIQIEASRKLNLFTQRNGTKAIYVGGLTYLEPILTISKIEKDRNALPLSLANIDSFYLKAGRKVLHTKTIDILKYQNSTFDLNLNLAKFNLPYYKSNFQANLSAGLIRTNISDSVTVSGTSAMKANLPFEKTLTSFRWGVSIIYELKPDSRYGFLLGWDYRYISLLSRDYIMPVVPSSISNTFWTDAYLKTNTNSKLFFRYRISYIKGSQADNFVQIQLGYLLDIFKTNAK